VTTLTAPTIPTVRQSRPRSTSSNPASRRVAVLIGALYLVATVGFATAEALINGVLDAPGYLSGASDHGGALTAAALFAFVQGVAIVGIAVFFFPILKRQSEPLALAYVGFRLAELAATLLYIATPLLVLHVGNGLQDGTVDGSASSGLAALFDAQHHVAILLIYFVTSVNGSILAFLLYRSRLVPRPVALLGIVGYPALLVGAALTALQVVDVSHGAGMLAMVPGGLFELVLPIWLFAKGFSTHLAATPTPHQ
jgi:hypothetical protein